MNIYSRKLVNLIKKKLWVTYFIIGLLVLFWFNNGSFIDSGDLGWPPIFIRFFEFCSFFWDDSVNFGYSAPRQLASLFPFATLGYLLELVFNISNIQKTILYICFSFSGFSMYLLTQYYIKNKVVSYCSGFIYMFSIFAISISWNPSYGMTFPFFCFLPLMIYIFLKFIKNFSLSTKRYYLITILLFISPFNMSNVNPAFSLLYLVFCVVFFIYEFILSSKKLILATNTIFFLLIYSLINIYWILPFIYDLKNQFNSASNLVANLISDREMLSRNSVNFYDSFRGAGYWTINSGQWGDFYFKWKDVYNSYGYTIFSYILICYIFSLLLIKKNTKILFFIILFVFAILINSGYKNKTILVSINDYIFFNDSIRRAFRSLYSKTGILLIIPISILTSLSFNYLISKIVNTKYKLIFTFLNVIFFVIFFCLPFANGDVIKKAGKILPSYVIKIPEDYYKLKEFDEFSKLDYRYISLPLPTTYNLLLNWNKNNGYMGGDFIRFFTKKPIIYQNNNSSLINFYIKNINSNDFNFNFSNIKYVINRKDSVSIGDIYKTSKFDNKNVIYETRYLTIAKVDNVFLPHLYTPKKIIFSGKNLNLLQDIVGEKDYEVRTVTYFKNQNIGKLDTVSDSKIKIKDTPILEFKKINPTKYRVMVHGAKSSFPLVFSESFHDGWKAYVKNISTSDSLSAGPVLTSKVRTRASESEKLSKYKILDGNEEDQASSGAVLDFIDKGWVSTLGDGKEKEIKHMKWTPSAGSGQETVDYVEKFNIDFISKNFQDTIQNDNLSEGNIFETWFAKGLGGSDTNGIATSFTSFIPRNDNVKQISDDRHLQANGYANSWIINTNEVCAGSGGIAHPSHKASEWQGSTSIFPRNDISWCRQNADGSYDFEMVIEFWPQRLFYIGGAVSLSTFIGCIIYLIWDKFKNRKLLIKDKQENEII